jgi:hypothetical protein
LGKRAWGTFGQRQLFREKMEVAMPDRKETKPDPKTQKQVAKRPDADPKDKPTRDSREDPTPNPNGDILDTTTREEIEKIRPNLKR